MPTTRRTGGVRGAGAERLPLPVLGLATVAVAFFALPFAGLLWRVPWSSAWSILTDSTVRTALRLSLVDDTVGDRTVAALRCSAGLAARPCRLPRPRSRAGPVHAVDGAAASGRWGGAVLRPRPARPGRRVPRRVVRDPRCRSRPPASSSPRRSWRCRSSCSPSRARCASSTALRGRRPHAGGSALVPVPAGDAPAIRPALIAGAVLAWARALGEFGATITFAGNFPGTTQTMPLAIYIAQSPTRRRRSSSASCSVGGVVRRARRVARALAHVS